MCIFFCFLILFSLLLFFVMVFSQQTSITALDWRSVEESKRIEHIRWRQKEFQLKMELIFLSSGCDTKRDYHREMKNWLNGIFSKVEIVGKCLKFLISKDSFLERILYRTFSKLICYCNIRFPYRIRKVIGNIFINILGHDGKKLWDGDRLVEIIWSG